MKTRLAFIALMFFSIASSGVQICEVVVDEAVRLFAPRVMEKGVPYEWALTITNKEDFPVQRMIYANVLGKNAWATYSFSAGIVCTTNFLVAGDLKKIVFPLGKDWMPSNMVPDCIDFFIFTTNLTTGASSLRIFQAVVPLPEWRVPDLRGNPITQDDFPALTEDGDSGAL